MLNRLSVFKDTDLHAKIKKINCSVTGNRTRLSAVRASNPNDYTTISVSVNSFVCASYGLSKHFTLKPAYQRICANNQFDCSVLRGFVSSSSSCCARSYVTGPICLIFTILHTTMDTQTSKGLEEPNSSLEKKKKFLGIN